MRRQVRRVSVFLFSPFRLFDVLWSNRLKRLDRLQNEQNRELFEYLRDHYVILPKRFLVVVVVLVSVSLTIAFQKSVSAILEDTLDTASSAAEQIAKNAAQDVAGQTAAHHASRVTESAVRYAESEARSIAKIHARRAVEGQFSELENSIEDKADDLASSIVSRSLESVVDDLVESQFSNDVGTRLLDGLRPHVKKIAENAVDKRAEVVLHPDEALALAQIRGIEDDANRILTRIVDAKDRVDELAEELDVGTLKEKLDLVSDHAESLESGLRMIPRIISAGFVNRAGRQSNQAIGQAVRVDHVGPGSGIYTLSLNGVPETYKHPILVATPDSDGDGVLVLVDRVSKTQFRIETRTVDNRNADSGFMYVIYDRPYTPPSG